MTKHTTLIYEKVFFRKPIWGFNAPKPPLPTPVRPTM